MKTKNLKYYLTSMLLALNIALTGCTPTEDVEVIGTTDAFDEKSIEGMKTLEETVQETLSPEEETSREEVSEDLEEKKDVEENPSLKRLKELATIDEIFITGNRKDCGYQIEFSSKDKNSSYTYVIKDGIDEVRDFLDSLIFTDTSLVYFKNCNDSEIAAMISKPENIKSISIANSSISHLDFLEEYKNLESLKIQTCPNLENIDALWNLTKLRGVALFGTSVSDIEPLTRSKDIIYLDLRCNKIEDATPLKNLPRLQTLNLEYNAFCDDETLNFLVEEGIISDYRKELFIITSRTDCIAILTEEYIDQTSFDELLIKKLESKKGWNEDKYYLELRDENGVNCMYTLAGRDDDIGIFKNTYNKITLADVDDLSILEKIQNKDAVTELNLLSCSMNNLEGIKAFQNITDLNIADCDSLSDISELASTPNISNIIIKNTPISDISSLSSVEDLESIWLSYTSVEDLDALLSLPKLKEGYFYWNNIEDSTDFMTLRIKDVYVKFNFGTRSKDSKQEKEYTK